MKNKKLLVVFLSPGWPLNYFPNGIVTYIKNIIAGFDAGVEPFIVARRLKKTPCDISVVGLEKFQNKRGLLIRLLDKLLGCIKHQYTDSKFRKVRFQREIQALKKAINSFEGVDLVEIEESFGRAFFLKKETTVPIITRLHGPWFIHGPIMNSEDSDRVEIEGKAILISDGVTSPSLDVLEKVREYYNCPLPNARVIPNPIPTVDVEQQWKYNSIGKQTVLFVGRFDLHKGGDLAIDAFRIIASKNENVELLFVGPDLGVIYRDKNYFFQEYIEEFIIEESVKGRIQFLGHCDTEKIAKLRKISTVTMVTSRYDNFPMSLLEAVAIGSPVVCTAVGGMKEIIINEFNGLLAEPESASSIAEHVLTLLSNPEKMQMLSKNAIKDSRERFSPRIVAKQTEEYYRSILAN